MKTETILRLAALAAMGLLGAGAAQAQMAPPEPVVATTGSVAGTDSGPVEQADAPPEARRQSRRRRANVSAYLEVDQTISADLSADDVFTYSTVAAGVDGSVVNRRVAAQVSYRYERHIEWSGNVPDRDVHSGIAAVSAQLVPGAVTLDAGALATRTAGEGRALVTDRDPAVNVYAGYVGPSVTTRVGDVSVGASYRLGYVAVDDDTLFGASDGYDDSVSHTATVSVGQDPGPLPVGWTVGAGYAREDAGAFDNRFEAAYVRADVVVPVSPTFAVTAGVGYEKIESSRQDVVRDANGAIIVTPDGQLTPDPNAPRLLTYETDGLIYDAGFIWRPNPRTEVQARAGHRYGGTTVVGTIGHQINGRWGIQANVYDGVETFGRLMVGNLSGLPEEFSIQRDPITGGLTLGGCVFGTDPGSGVCFDPVLQSVSSGTFRHRGANLILSGTRGRWELAAGAGYAHRRYSRPALLGSGTVRGEDSSVTLFGQASYALGRDASLGFNLFATWFDNDLAGFDPVTTIGATASYERAFLMQRLQLLAALGLFHADDGASSSTIASGQAGLRYTFW